MQSLSLPVSVVASPVDRRGSVGLIPGSTHDDNGGTALTPREVMSSLAISDLATGLDGSRD